MQNLVNSYLEKFKRERHLRRRLSGILLLLALVVVTGVYWQLKMTGAALTNETYCGEEEHQHDESCYEKVLICGLEEGEETSGHTHTDECYETVTTLVCCLEEREGHTHTNACYTTTLTCGLEEGEGHTHSESCYDEEGNLICSLEESEGHTHTDACYTTTLTCGLEESEGHTHTDACYETEQVLICGLEEAEAETGHTHTDACYEEQLVCGLEEHTHTVDCLIDETADVEIASDWEATIPASLSGTWAENLVAVAKSQIGYTESTANFKLDEDGETRKGYTRYGAWAGNIYGDWDAMFVSFCLHYAGISQNDFPEATGAYAWSVTLKNMEMFEDAAGYIPEAGDLVFFDTDNDGKIDHVGIVSTVNEESGKLTVIEGDYETGDADCVKETTYALSESTIDGYGVLPEQLEEETEEETEEGTEEETEESTEEETEQDAVSYTLIYEGEDYSVTVTYGEDAGLPENVELVASEYAKDSETYLSRYAQAEEMYGWTTDMTESVRLFQVGFYVDGEEVEPSEEVEVVIAYINKDGLTEYTVTHFGEAAEEVDAESGYEDGTQTVSFGLDSFSDVMISVATSETEDDEVTVVGEEGDQEAMQALAASGYFSYWSSVVAQNENPENQISLSSSSSGLRSTIAALLGSSSGSAASSAQIVEDGGTVSNEEDGVSISKMISGTDTENVFDITLSVTTTTNISELYTEPDMAVIIVMDISNSMTSTYGDTTRYAAAMNAAEQFLDQFASATNGTSQIGFVAFNTDAHEIFALTSCSSTSEATALKNTMRTQTGTIINQNKYDESHSRFTNIEAGLKMAADMLAGATNENKYIIFLSDGFPTTYISSGYSGYDPYTSSGTKGADGVFYDYVTGYYCTYGASYSDKAAIRAREMATAIKASGVNIFSIGVDVGSQTIEGYEVYGKDYSVIDRTGMTYEIGSKNKASAYENWLKGTATTGIGSGYYYDSTDEEGLISAFNQIFAEIQSLNEASSQAKWVVSDPIPTITENGDETVEFIGFYDCTGTLQVYPTTTSLSGSSAEGGENTASYSSDSISWDLKSSGYTSSTSGGTTTYTYTLTYRVRLQNESDDFTEGSSYATNGNASLTYQIVTIEGGVTTVSDEKTLAFPVPTVKGYLGELTFTKVDQDGNPVEGAEFTLSHADTCNECRGDGSSSVTVDDMTAVSDADGNVSFSGIPSGHTYTLTETSVPDGYSMGTSTYTVTVEYDVVTVTKTSATGDSETWDGTIANYSVPTVEKKVKDSNGDWVDENTAGISDTVEFKSTIDNPMGSTNLVLHDILSNGLAFSSVSGVFVNNGTMETAVASEYYTIIIDTASDGCSFEVAFTDDFIKTLTADDVIVVYYSATVTKDAVIEGTGNPNETYVSYGTDATSEHDTTVTYVYQLNVYKYYGSEALSSAEFVFYYQEGEAAYYAIVDNGTLTGWTTNESSASALPTDSDGMIYIKGLDVGSYYLEETNAPDGYILLEEPIVVTITSDTSSIANGVVTYKSASAESNTDAGEMKVNGVSITDVVTVENTPGYELPAAGGSGVEAYGLTGFLLCFGASLLLLYRRRRIV